MDPPKKHTCIIHILGPKEIREKDLFAKEKDECFINCTSRSTKSWCHQMSPFYLGPVTFPDGTVALNLENAWQFAKVYKQHTDATGEPNAAYWTWAKEGWAAQKPHRFPMGPGAIPEYSLWNGEKLKYVEARKKIYAPIYASLVVQTDGFKQLQKIYETHDHIWLWDFDGYDYLREGKTLQQVINDPRKKMGHAFVIAMLLKGEHVWEN